MNKPSETARLILLDEIKEILQNIDVFQLIKKGFIAYFNGEAVIPPVGELLFNNPPGDVHIKYGYIESEPYYVVKIASGFYENSKIGLPSSQGLNLLFDKSNGILKAILLDEGYLTDVRTGVAGALASICLANSDSKVLGIVGAGIQAQMQLEYHLRLFKIDKVLCWNHNPVRAKEFARQQGALFSNIKVVDNPKQICSDADIIVTTTPSTKPLLHDKWIKPGTHITAVGSDTSEKGELNPRILDNADVLVVDSLSQSENRGEIFNAQKAGLLKDKFILELGAVLANPKSGRLNKQQITVADLTGVAVQDLMISQAIFENI